MDVILLHVQGLLLAYIRSAIHAHEMVPILYRIVELSLTVLFPFIYSCVRITLHKMRTGVLTLDSPMGTNQSALSIPAACRSKLGS